MDKVILSEREGFGGSRIIGGQASADLWNDGVVLGAAWTFSQPAIEGTIFGFRGTLTPVIAIYRTKRHSWHLKSDDGTFSATFPTRRDALKAVIHGVQMDAFRELNRIEAAR